MKKLLFSLVLSAVCLFFAIAQSNDAENYISQSGELFRKRDFTGAIELLSKAIQAYPNDARFYGLRGAAYFFMGDKDRTIADCTQAIKLNPRNSANYNTRARAYIGKGDFDKAIADCSQAIRLEPGKSSDYLQRGKAYGGKHDFEHARGDLTQTIKLNSNVSDVAEAYAFRGIVNWELGDRDGTQADIGKALELEPENATALRFLNVLQQQQNR
jgi:tetratricopeptide (TPR) repeat protein